VVALTYADHTLIRFDDHSYRWVDVKRFTWDGCGTDEATLSALIGHSRYRDIYITADSHEHDSETIHGPYRVAEITANSFDAIEPKAALAVVEEFCALDSSPPRPDVQGRIQSAVSALHEAACYRLRELPHAVHEFGFVLWEFRELVAINRSTGAVFLVVMAID
jgi:hypothetical protein